MAPPLQLLLAAATGLAGFLLGRSGQRKARGAQLFDMDPQLEGGKHFVVDLPLCRVLLMDDSQYPCWLVLVPRVNRVRELFELSAAQQAQLWHEVAAAERIIQSLYRPFKLNVAAIGNIVAQLHVHVTGRLQSDPAWPGPCYGAAPAVPLAAPEHAVAMLQEAFKSADV